MNVFEQPSSPNHGIIITSADDTVPPLDDSAAKAMIIDNLYQIQSCIIYLNGEFDVSKSSNIERFCDITLDLPQLVEDIRELVRTFQVLLDCNFTHYVMSKCPNAEYSRLIDELHKQYPITPITPITPADINGNHIASFVFPSGANINLNRLPLQRQSTGSNRLRSPNSMSISHTVHTPHGPHTPHTPHTAHTSHTHTHTHTPHTHAHTVHGTPHAAPSPLDRATDRIMHSPHARSAMNTSHASYPTRSSNINSSAGAGGAVGRPNYGTHPHIHSRITKRGVGIGSTNTSGRNSNQGPNVLNVNVVPNCSHNHSHKHNRSHAHNDYNQTPKGGANNVTNMAMYNNNINTINNNNNNNNNSNNNMNNRNRNNSNTNRSNRSNSGTTKRSQIGLETQTQGPQRQDAVVDTSHSGSGSGSGIVASVVLSPTNDLMMSNHSRKSHKSHKSQKNSGKKTKKKHSHKQKQKPKQKPKQNPKQKQKQKHKRQNGHSHNENRKGHHDAEKAVDMDVELEVDIDIDHDLDLNLDFDLHHPEYDSELHTDADYDGNLTENENENVNVNVNENEKQKQKQHDEEKRNKNEGIITDDNNNDNDSVDNDIKVGIGDDNININVGRIHYIENIDSNIMNRHRSDGNYKKDGQFLIKNTLELDKINTQSSADATQDDIGMIIGKKFRNIRNVNYQVDGIIQDEFMILSNTGGSGDISVVTNAATAPSARMSNMPSNTSLLTNKTNRSNRKRYHDRDRQNNNNNNNNNNYKSRNTSHISQASATATNTQTSHKMVFSVTSCNSDVFSDIFKSGDNDGNITDDRDIGDIGDIEEDDDENEGIEKYNDKDKINNNLTNSKNISDTGTNITINMRGGKRSRHSKMKSSTKNSLQLLDRISSLSINWDASANASQISHLSHLSHHTSNGMRGSHLSQNSGHQIHHHRYNTSMSSLSDISEHNTHDYPDNNSKYSINKETPMYLRMNDTNNENDRNQRHQRNQRRRSKDITNNRNNRNNRNDRNKDHHRPQVSDDTGDLRSRRNGAGGKDEFHFVLDYQLDMESPRTPYSPGGGSVYSMDSKYTIKSPAIDSVDNAMDVPLPEPGNINVGNVNNGNINNGNINSGNTNGNSRHGQIYSGLRRSQPRGRGYGQHTQRQGQVRGHGHGQGHGQGNGRGHIRGGVQQNSRGRVHDYDNDRNHNYNQHIIENHEILQRRNGMYLSKNDFTEVPNIHAQAVGRRVVHASASKSSSISDSTSYNIDVD